MDVWSSQIVLFRDSFSSVWQALDGTQATGDGRGSQPHSSKVRRQSILALQSYRLYDCVCWKHFNDNVVLTTYPWDQCTPCGYALFASMHNVDFALYGLVSVAGQRITLHPIKF